MSCPRILMTDDLKENALHYHSIPRPGKVEVVPTKPLATQMDLSLAYSPGVAAPCEAIAEDPSLASRYTARANLVGVITNGTAVLGLGAIGPLAAKPVMEGKGVLFKKFAGIDVFDVEILERDPDKLVEIIANLEPTFGGINLEDIKAPECFEIEEKLRERMRIPVFHDDQHGTAIITAAAILNALRIVDKRIDEVRLVGSGAGAAGIACLDLLVRLGMRRGHITLCDSRGVIFVGRDENMDRRKSQYAIETNDRTLGEAIVGADVFLGLSKPGVLSHEMVCRMAERPIILALANPEPEIRPEVAKDARSDVVIATGRSDYPNQVNNVLCFPYIFRGALDVGATAITEEMKLACVKALADLAIAEPPEEVRTAYGGQRLQFGPDSLIPNPFAPRLIVELPIAVARAAMESGVAARPIVDINAYRETLERFLFRTGLVMKPLFERAKERPMRVVYAEGEDVRVLRAVQAVRADGLAVPVLVGRKLRVESAIADAGLSLRLGEGVELVDPQDNPWFESCWQEYHRVLARRGVTPDEARERVGTRNTVLGALLVRLGRGDALICGTSGRFGRHLQHVSEIIGLRTGIAEAAAMNAVILRQGTLFIADTNVTQDPTAEQLAETATLAVEAVRRFGLTPKVALLSHSNFGSSQEPGAVKMSRALELIREREPGLEIEGEMQADLALSEQLRARIFPESRLRGQANVLLMPNRDAANIAFNLVKMVADGIAIGPMLMGMARTAHVLSASATVRRIVNMTAFAAVEAQRESATSEPAPTGGEEMFESIH